MVDNRPVKTTKFGQRRFPQQNRFNQQGRFGQGQPGGRPDERDKKGGKQQQQQKGRPAWQNWGPRDQQRVSGDGGKEGHGGGGSGGVSGAYSLAECSL